MYAGAIWKLFPPEKTPCDSFCYEVGPLGKPDRIARFSESGGFERHLQQKNR